MKQIIALKTNFPKIIRYNRRSITIKDEETGKKVASYYNIKDIIIGAKPALRIIYFNRNYREDLNKNFCIESKKIPGSFYTGFNPLGFINANNLIDRISKSNRGERDKSLSGIKPGNHKY